MAGPIDHLVLCVHDLEAARERYARFGFTLAPPGRHPFGTGNSLVQFRHSFLELLAVVEPDRIAPMRPEHFSFSAFNRDFLATGEGCSMLVFASADAAEDARAYARAGLGSYAPFRFERPARLPDGSIATVAFTLAFATDPRLRRAAFFACQHHTPELFWQRDLQSHANGALDIAEVALVAELPGTLADLLAKLTDPRAVADIEDGVVAATAHGTLIAVTPEGFRRRYAGAPPPDLSAGPRFAGCTVTVADLARAGEVLAAAGVAAAHSGDRLVIAPAQAFGVALAFEAQRSKR